MNLTNFVKLQPNIHFILFYGISQSATTNGAGESFSQLVQLYQHAETQLNQVKTMFATLMENAALQQKSFSNELRTKSAAYIDDELKKLESSSVQNSDSIKQRISNCAVDVDEIIESAITEFVNMLDEAEGMVYATEERLRIEPSSDDIDEINDEVDDILDEFKEKFEATIIPLVEDLLRKFKNKLVSLKSDMQTCFDEALN